MKIILSLSLMVYSKNKRDKKEKNKIKMYWYKEISKSQKDTKWNGHIKSLQRSIVRY